MRLRNKIAIVTGAASGIGEAISDLFCEEGATVVGLDLNARSSTSLRPFDVRDEAQWKAVVDETMSEYGRIDVLINNAGIVKAYGGIVDVEVGDWDHVLDVNLRGTFLGMRTVIPAMASKGGGSIVNFSSIWGVVGAVGVAPYQASKGAVRTLTKNAAISYVNAGVRANSIHPGLVMTPLISAQAADVTQEAIDATPMKRGAQPREIAYGALFLASEESSFVTGTELVMDGGFLAV
jgi:NAD(P)-dependent dehydrogenase (short-subunit alcohol dehydrogenase family)